MSLELVADAPATTKLEYYCPVHPQIVRDQPGNCPICGMALEPRTVTLEEGRNPELVDMSRRLGNIRQNLFLAFVYNLVGVPVAAGVLYPFFLGILIKPDLGQRRNELEFSLGSRQRPAAAADETLVNPLPRLVRDSLTVEAKVAARDLHEDNGVLPY